jgi:hypothetical protein
MRSLRPLRTQHYGDSISILVIEELGLNDETTFVDQVFKMGA